MESFFFTKCWRAHLTKLNTAKRFEISRWGKKLWALEIHYILCSKQSRPYSMEFCRFFIRSLYLCILSATYLLLLFFSVFSFVNCVWVIPSAVQFCRVIIIIFFSRPPFFPVLRICRRLRRNNKWSISSRACNPCLTPQPPFVCYVPNARLSANQIRYHYAGPDRTVDFTRQGACSTYSRLQHKGQLESLLHSRAESSAVMLFALMR
jgi:hypothetical protein